MDKKYDQYLEEIPKLIKYLGINNINKSYHCQTRLRLNLKNFQKVNLEEIKKLKSVTGVIKQADQLQLIIGTDVARFYTLFEKELNLSNGNNEIENKEKIKDLEKNQEENYQENNDLSLSKVIKNDEDQKLNLFQKLMVTFSEIFIPLIPVLVAGGLILAFRNLLEMDWTGNGGSAVNASSFASSLDNWLWLPAQAIFWYLPVYVVWSMFNRKNKAPAMGIAIGIMLVAPGTLVNMYDVSGALGNVYVPYFYVAYIPSETVDSNSLIFTSDLSSLPDTATVLGAFGGGVYTGSDIASWSVFVEGQQIYLFPSITADMDNDQVASILIDAEIDGTYAVNGFFQAIDALDASYFTAYWPFALSYIGQVVPALFVGWFALWFYELVERHTYNAVAYVWPPFITILVVQIVALGFIGPLGALLGFGISYGFRLAFTNPIAKYFFGPIFGLLYPVLVITGLHQTFVPVMLQLTSSGDNYIFPMLALSNVAQGSAVFAVVYMLKRDAKMREEGSSAATSCWLGVTEPAMYGVNLRFMFPFVAAMIGSAISGLFIVAFGITAAGIGMGGILGFLNIDSSAFGVEWLAMPLFILIMIGDIFWTFAITLVLASKSNWFDKWTSDNWNDYRKDVEDNLKENMYDIMDRKYSKIFDSTSDKYYQDYQENLEIYVNKLVESYQFKDNKAKYLKDHDKDSYQEKSKNFALEKKESLLIIKEILEQQKELNKEEKIQEKK